MGLWQKLKGELIDIIEWVDVDGQTIVWKFPRYGNEIKNGAKLIVRESQVAIFVNEGQIADVFTPGTYTLETKNLPILSTLQGWPYGFKSPFKAEVYFVSTRVFTNQKWGTPQAFYIRDKDFGRVTLRAFGTYSFQVVDAVKFFKRFVGVEQEFTTDQIIGELRSLIITRFIDSIGESGLSLLDFASNYKDLSEFVQKKLQEEFLEYGLKIHKFLINSINLPEELQKRLDEGTGINMVGDLGRYQQFKMAEAMGDAAQSGNVTGGLEGMFGLAMMQSMMNQQKTTGQGPGVPPPPPPQMQFYIAVGGQQQGPYTLEQLRQLIASGQVKQDTYVWRQGLNNWVLAKDLPEVAQLFAGSVPPPPPPPPPQK